MKAIISAWISLNLVWLVPGQVLGDPVVDFFSDELNGRHYQVIIERFNASTYDGIMQIDGDKMQFDARRNGDLISGRLNNAAEQPGFRAKLEGGRRVVLWRGKAE